MPPSSKRILFLVPYPLGESPSQRFRFEQYLGILTQSGMEFKVHSFLNSHDWKLFYEPRNTLRKILVLIRGFLLRIGCLFKISKYHYVFIHREATPVGPPVIEWIISRILLKKVIYDFDDAIWATDRNNEPWTLKFLKCRSKVSAICRLSYKISCGNKFLADFAKKYNDHVVINPTTIDSTHHDPDLYIKKENEKRQLVIGWTGSHSTLKYLVDAENILKRIESKFPDVQIVVIADRKPTMSLNNLRFIPWKEETEIEDLMGFDIGIMPLPDEIWTRGKCGFKALQYMALRIPAVCSPVGVNSEIIDNGRNGFLCTTTEEWESALATLINNAKLRKEMGENGRIKVINNYSVLSNSETFLKLFA